MLIDKSKVGIVLPTYNEDENISDLINAIFKEVPGASVLIIDDSPNEDTYFAAKNAIANLPCLEKIANYRIIRRMNESGRASAVREGIGIFVNENIDYIIEMDTDGSHPPAQLPELINMAKNENADIVICSRDVPGSKIIGWPYRRKVLHFLANFSCSLLLRLEIKDYMNAYRIYSGRAAKIVMQEAGKISTGFWAFGETLVHIKLRGGIVKEIPTFFVNRTRGKSRVALRVVIGCMFELLQVFILLKKLKSKSLKF